MSSAREPNPKAPEEAPGILPGTSLRESPPIPTPTSPEIGEGALLLGKYAARDAIPQFVILSDTAPAMVIPMKGDRYSDRVLRGKENRTFL